jgi:putative flippase GtrA
VAPKLLFLASVQKQQVQQLLASGMSGVAATAVDVGALVLQVQHGTPVPIAAFISATLGACVGFTVNKYVAFRDRSAITPAQLARFGFVAVVTAMLIAVAMDVVAVKLHVPYVLAKVICSALIFVGWTYPAQRRLVFQPQPSS